MKTKMNVLVTTILAALAAQAAVGASEGGDTWSDVQALHEQTVSQASSGDSARALSYAAPIGGSEGGDTWSGVQPRPESRSTRTAAVPAKPAL